MFGGCIDYIFISGQTAFGNVYQLDQYNFFVSTLTTTMRVSSVCSDLPAHISYTYGLRRLIQSLNISGASCTGSIGSTGTDLIESDLYGCGRCTSVLIALEMTEKSEVCTFTPMRCKYTSTSNSITCNSSND